MYAYIDKLKWIIFLSVAFILAVFQPYAQADQRAVQVKVNDAILSCQPNPVILQGRTLVPLRTVAETLGCTVEWQGYDQSAAVSNGNTQIIFKIGADEAVVNGQITKIDVPVYLIQGSTMVPIRFLAGQMGRKLDWDNNQQLIIIGDEITEKIRICSETTYKPFEFMQDGQYQGFDMDIIRAVAGAQKIDIEILPIGFDSLIPALRAGKADAVISAVSITEPRKEVVAFSDPYYTESLCMVVRNSNNKIQKFTDLSGKIIGVELGSLGNEYANKLKEQNDSTDIVVFESPQSMYTQLEIGTLDALLSFQSHSSYYIKTNPNCGLKIAGPVVQKTEQYGIMVRLDNTQLLQQLNTGLQKIRDNGQYDSIYQKWFGQGEAVDK